MKKKIKSKVYVSPCDQLNRILNLRKLTDKQVKGLVETLAKYINTSKNSIDLLQYAKVIITAVLSDEDQVFLNEVLKGLKSQDKEAKMVATHNLLAGVYSSIVHIYPEFELNVVCSYINTGTLGQDREEPNQPRGNTPVSQSDDNEEKFKRTVKSETKKKIPKLNGKLVDDLESLLNGKVIGQSEAVKTVCDAIRLKAAGFAKVLNLFFIGKTGQGKTYLAEILGDNYLGNFWKISCGEFQSGHEINKLIGAPSGYIGHTGKSIMHDRSTKSNAWVILIDEIEKANDKIYNFLLELMEKGKCVDNSGNEVDLSESIFIYTSNCGMRDLKTNTTNFNSTRSKDSDREEVLAEFERHFSPEFRNRIDDIVFFNDLSQKDIEEIALLKLKELPLKVTSELVNFATLNGYSKDFGARFLNRFIRKNIALPLAKVILNNRKPSDGSNSYDVRVLGDAVEIVNIM